MKSIRPLVAVLSILSGISLSAYGLWSLTHLPSISFVKFSADARDTEIGILIFLIGAALALYGFFNLGLPITKHHEDSRPPQ